MNQSDNKESVLERLPHTAAELIRGLPDVYPALDYTPGDTLEQVAYFSGMRKVVKDLMAALDRQEQSLSNGDEGGYTGGFPLGDDFPQFDLPD